MEEDDPGTKVAINPRVGDVSRREGLDGLEATAELND